MKASEIITEALKDNDIIHPEHEAVMSKTVKFPDITNQYYHMYRLGMNLAGQSGADTKMTAKSSAMANNLIITPYHDTEMKMVKNAAREMGHPTEEIVKSKSQEPGSVNTASPVARAKKNKYGV